MKVTWRSLKKMHLRAQSTMERSVCSAMTHMSSNVLSFPWFSQIFWSWCRWATILFCICSSSGSQRRNSVTSWGILGTCEEKGAQWMQVCTADDMLSSSSDLMIWLEVAAELGGLRAHSDGGLWLMVVSGGLWRILVGVWSVCSEETRGGLGCSLNPAAWINAFLCCFRARSCLYMGPNLFLPPLVRSARTADRKCWWI